MFKKSDKKIKENDQESNAAFEEFFNQVLKKMPARSAKIISSSLTVSKAKAEQFLALIKEKVLSDDAKTKEDINTIIDECSKDLDVNITDDQREQIAELMQKINKLDLNVNDLKEQASKIYDKLSEMDIDAQGIFAKIKTVLSSIFAALSGLLQ